MGAVVATALTVDLDGKEIVCRVGLVLLAMIANPAVAQVRNDPEPPVTQQNGASTFSADGRVWRTGDVGSGQTGQRQTRDQVAQDAGIEPMRRIGSRIQNRAQTRIRNRIDRYYDPQANATSPFVVAGDQARTAGRRPR